MAYVIFGNCCGGRKANKHEEYRLLGCDTVCLVKTDVSEEVIASIFRVKRITELGTTLAVTTNCQLLLALFLSRGFSPT
jgi:hypothetical protein